MPERLCGTEGCYGAFWLQPIALALEGMENYNE